MIISNKQLKFDLKQIKFLNSFDFLKKDEFILIWEM